EALPFKGEALVARAYAHHMLAIFFAKAYEIGGANTSPGIPYVTKPETVLLAKYERGTVQGTYDMIEKDLLEGLELINDSKYKVPKYHFTKAAAHAFASRFYLFKGEWQKVIDHANATVPSGDWVSNLRPIAGSFKTNGFAQFNTDFTKTNVKSTLLLANNYSTYQRIYTTPRYGYGAQLVKMFSDVNVTGKIVQNFILNYGLPHYTTYKWREYFFYTTASTGFPYLPVILLSVDETLMNRAEAYAELQRFDLALRDINDFYSVRLAGYNPSKDAVTQDKIRAFYSIDDPKQGIIRTILDAKKAEFLQEGIRWIDIARKKLTVRKNLYKPSGEEEFIELSANDPRRVFQIPEQVTLAGIEQNPR
ncbi:MAG: RagB/SusD family nutrient uptake outer membrane protein, partial [Chitinophagaceae bacterium]